MTSRSMLHSRALLVAACCLILGAAFNHRTLAADGGGTRTAVQQTGSVTGRVQNAVIGRYLNNARISIKGTEIVGFTDEFGVYRLPSVPVGSIVLEVFYTGMDPQ